MAIFDSTQEASYAWKTRLTDCPLGTHTHNCSVSIVWKEVVAAMPGTSGRKTRTATAEVAAATTSGAAEMLTTGQVAAVLGTTPRHVVNLCLRGELPYTIVGTHRRIHRADALALAGREGANRGGPLTDDQLRSLWLHRVVAGRVATDPAGTLAAARVDAERALSRQPDGARWLAQWLSIIDRGPEAVMRVLAATDPLARELRQNSPFLALLTDTDRLAVLDAFRNQRDRIRRSR
jgi:excisionase family DNA binding protein